MEARREDNAEKRDRQTDRQIESRKGTQAFSKEILTPKKKLT